jgi:hypothetical protein
MKSYSWGKKEANPPPPSCRQDLETQYARTEPGICYLSGVSRSWTNQTLKDIAKYFQVEPKTMRRYQTTSNSAYLIQVHAEDQETFANTKPLILGRQIITPAPGPHPGYQAHINRPIFDQTGKKTTIDLTIDMKKINLKENEDKPNTEFLKIIKDIKKKKKKSGRRSSSVLSDDEDEKHQDEDSNKASMAPPKPRKPRPKPVDTAPPGKGTIFTTANFGQEDEPTSNDSTSSAKKRKRAAEAKERKNVPPSDQRRLSFANANGDQPPKGQEQNETEKKTNATAEGKGEEKGKETGATAEEKEKEKGKDLQGPNGDPTKDSEEDAMEDDQDAGTSGKDSEQNPPPAQRPRTST